MTVFGVEDRRCSVKVALRRNTKKSIDLGEHSWGWGVHRRESSGSGGDGVGRSRN